ncbi:hypothetical protein B0H16DRAFT_1721318 [Mycena metata]|uniref:Pyridoxamine 5'-phosphate oxidase Alr4036 family FMN-binding domain-containing protein n=1 Tax=Mycena metata TaxID=1033252 RepID=A0AAD7NF12_9AGAR|nr:hypothetical protein B0H16DRAFT_1721318 [Mycena metata]
MQMAVPRWKAALEKALAAHPKRLVWLARSSNVQYSSSHSTPVPHVRSCGFVFPTDNPSRPLLLSTTDVRTPKTPQMIANPHVQVVGWINGAAPHRRKGAHRPRTGPRPPQALCAPISALSEGQKYDWEAKRLELFKVLRVNS